MNQELDINVILSALREQIGLLAQDNAILKATVKKLEDDRNPGHCACSPND